MGKRSRSKREPVHAASPALAEPTAAPILASDRRTDILIAAALAIAVFIVFSGVATHSFVIVEDSVYITQNPHVATGLNMRNVTWAFTSIYAAYWLPVTWMSHMLDVQMFGLDAGKHLLVNVLFHAVNTVLLFWFLLRATGRRWPSAVVAALFALHPLHVESVAWASSRKDVLSTAFMLIALLFYVRYVRTRVRSYYVGLLVAFVIGLMAKPMLVTFPFALLLLDWWPLNRPLRSGLLMEKIPLFAASVASSLVTMRTQEVAMAAMPLSVRVGNAMVSYAAYLGKTVWPAHLAVIYPFRSHVSGAALAGASVLLIGLTALSIVAARRYPYVPVGWFWFLGTLVPAIGLVQVGLQAMADRFTYIPLIGIFVAVVWLIADVIHNRAVLIALSAVLIVCLTAVTIRQVRYWRDSVTLLTHAIETVPNNDPAHTWLGTALLHTDRQAAMHQFEEALKINPLDYGARVGMATVLDSMGDSRAALQQATLAQSSNPNNPAALKTLGALELRAGRKEEALKLLRRALDQGYDALTAAEAAEAAGNRDEAIAKYRETLELRGDEPDPHNNLAALLAEAGQNDEAVREYQAAIRVDPTFYDAHMNLGALLSRMGNDPQAATEFDTAAKIRPKNSEPHVYLALINAQTGRFREAAAQMDAALAIDPAGANAQLTDAIRIPFKETNAVDYRAFLQRKAEGK